MGRGVAGCAEGAGAMAVPVEGTLVITGLGPADGGVGLGQGSFRTALGRSGRGARSATRASISCRFLSLAFARTDWWFSALCAQARYVAGYPGRGARR